jgi:hypothetical protein
MAMWTASRASRPSTSYLSGMCQSEWSHSIDVLDSMLDAMLDAMCDSMCDSMLDMPDMLDN